MKLVALIPHYRHIATLPTVIAALREYDLPIIVIDDGSGEQYHADLERICQNVQLFRLPDNVRQGLCYETRFAPSRCARLHSRATN